MASEINKLKAKFESNSSGSPKTPIKPLPLTPPMKVSEKAFSSPESTRGGGGSVGGSTGSLKVKPTTPTKKIPSKSDTLPSAKPAPTHSGTPPTTKAQAASHLAAVLKARTSSTASDAGGSSPSGKDSGGVESPRYRRPNETKKSGVNGVSESPTPPSKVPFKPSPPTGGKPALLHSSPKGNGKPISPPKEKGGVSMNGRAPDDVKAMFGVKLSHRERDNAQSPHSPANKVKPLQPPAFRDVKLRSASNASNTAGGSSTDDGTSKSSRDERANSVPRDIELSGSEEIPVTKKLPRTPPSKRRKSADLQRIMGEASNAPTTHDSSKVGGANGNSKKYKPRPPPKKPGLLTGDKPAPPPKPSSVTRSPSRAPPKPPIGSLKNSGDFSRPRRSSTPSSRESTPNLDTPTPTPVENEQKSRSRSITPHGSKDGSQIGDGSLEDTLTGTSPAREHSDTASSTNSWVMVDEVMSHWKGTSMVPTSSTKGGASPPTKKRPIPPQTPPRLKSPEAGMVDESRSPSVNALRSKFGGKSPNTTSSPPTSPLSPGTIATGASSKRASENRYSLGVEAQRERVSSPVSGPTVTVRKPDTSSGDAPLLGTTNNSRSVTVAMEVGSGSGRSNVDSGFISEVPEDLTTVGQATSNENVSEALETPPTPLSPESQPEEPIVEEVWDEARVSLI